MNPKLECYANFSMDRRKFVSLIINGAGLVAVGSFAVPSAIHSLTPVLKPDPDEEWRALGPASLFEIDKMNKAFFEQEAIRKSVYVWRRSADEYIVYSRSCTDLGCPVTWDPGSEWFYCPCHGGMFNKEGERTAGPPKKPLWRYATRVKDGMLEIDLRSVPPMV